MTVKPKVPGGDDQQPGGTADDQANVQDETVTPPAKGTVAYDTYKKAVDEAKAAKAKVAEFEKSKKDADDAALIEQGNFKKLLEQREIENANLKKENGEIKGTISDSRKMNAFLGAVTGDVPKQYWPLVDLESIALNPDTGMPDEASVKSAADKFQQEYADVVKKASKSKLPNDAPLGGGTKLTYDSWLKLPLKDQLARMKDVDKSTM